MRALWEPSNAWLDNTQLTRFTEEVNSEYGLALSGYAALHTWSVSNKADFWSALADFAGVKFYAKAKNVLIDEHLFPGARWFEGATLNFAEHCLQGPDDQLAIIEHLENGARAELSFAGLRSRVAAMQSFLQEQGVEAGDRVAGMVPNTSDTVVAMLAAASLGAVWSSCSPDFGTDGALDRFGQIEPKVLFCCDGYYYNGKSFNITERVDGIVARLDSVKAVVISRIQNEGQISQRPCFEFSEIVAERAAHQLRFTPVPFGHPLYILYSSGTTGKPKCIVHSVGGTLLQHLKEHQLHADLRKGDRLFFFTTCGWMMWNWLVSGLASDVTLVLYDGAPTYPKASSLFELVTKEQVAAFGASARYIAALQQESYKPSGLNLDSLRVILSTGSPLAHESFEYVYRDIKADLCLASISGGTDIVSSFVLGCPNLPVYAGQIQCAGLGMDVQVWNDSGQHRVSEKGELVCASPFPSAPIGFWGDADGSRYHEAYFDQFPNVWAHGDFAEQTPEGGYIIYGRSDAVLNPGGVRIGTAEIYRQVEQVEGILESVCVGQRLGDDVRVVLFVVMQAGTELTDELIKQLKAQIRSGASPRHVPAVILAVSDIPKTRSGKIAEIPVRKAIHGETISNTEALANPEALDLFYGILD